MAIKTISNSMITATKNNDASIVIWYDNPNIRDEECTYTFNKDGSASCVSAAWGTKTKFPKDTFVYNENKTPVEMVNEFNYYRIYKKQLNTLA